MRPLLALVVLTGATVLTAVGQPMDAPPRYGVRYKPKLYPQTTPKQTLDSVIEAVNQAEYPYLVAHLLDPAFVDARVADRVKQYEPVVEAELVKLRDAQKANPDAVASGARVPADPVGFQAMVVARARDRAFRQLARDVQEKLADEPDVMKDLRRFTRQGTYAETGARTRVGLPDVKDRAVFLTKVGDRWFIENRNIEEAKAAPEEKKAPPEEKK